jgi:MerR family redox-sensitive transcriptional activator SoxR
VSTVDLAIGEIATACQIKVSAVRYYSDVGLLSISRRVGGKRRFPPAAIARVEFIRRCQESGFTLDEIGGILNENPGRWRSAVDAKLIELRDRRQRLDETIHLLTEIRACGCATVDQCESFLRC